MLDILAQGAGTFGVLLIALPWILLFLVPVALIIAIPIYLIYSVSDIKNRVNGLKVLVVDDDESSVLSLVSILSGRAIDICIADNAESMLKELQSNEFDILFVDRMMPRQSGDVALMIADGAKLANEGSRSKVPVVFFTGNDQGFRIPQLKKFEVLDVWRKQVGYQALQIQIGAILDKIKPARRFA